MPSSLAYAASTTRCACTLRSATSPRTTSTTAAGRRSVAPVRPASSALAPNGSSRIEPASDDRHPRDPRPLLGKRGAFEGVARRHGRRRNPARTTPRSSLRTLNNQAPHSAQRWVEKCGRSIKGSETPQCHTPGPSRPRNHPPATTPETSRGSPPARRSACSLCASSGAAPTRG
jgi:hypothetical protein